MNINKLSELQQSGSASNVKPVTKESTTTSQAKPEQAEPTEAELKDAVERSNKALARQNVSDLQFEVVPDSQDLVVKVIDRETQEVIRQFPSKEMMELSNSIERMRGVLFSKSA